MNFATIKTLSNIIFEFHRCYYEDKGVLTPKNIQYRLNNLKITYEYFKDQKNILEQSINIFLRNNSRRKDKSENEHYKEQRALLRAIFNYVSFLVGKCCLSEDSEYAKVVLDNISSDWETAYAAKLLAFQVDQKTQKFIVSNNLYKLLNDECSKIEEKFTNCFNDFNLIRNISKQRSKNLQCLLYLLVRVVDNILSLLQVDFNEYERKVAHYTSLNGFKNIICKDSPLRLSSGDLMNDPSEGKLLYDFLDLESELIEDTFLTSFTFNHNSLNQFRLYGCTDNKEGTGISLVVDNNFFSSGRNGFVSSDITGDSEVFRILTEKNDDKLPLFRCIYFDKSTGFIQVAKRNKASFYQEFVGLLELSEIHTKCQNYEKDIDTLESKLYTQIQILKNLVSCVKKNFKCNIDINNLLKRTMRPLCFLFKHIAFQEEQECRIFYITEIGNQILEHNDDYMVVYLPYKPEIKKSLKNVYLGPALQDKFTFVRKAVVYDENIKIKVCDSPFVSK